MPIKVLKISEAQKLALEDRWPRKRWLNEKLLAYVREIIEDVKKRGDIALIDLTAKFDGVKLKVDQLKVSREEIEEAYDKVSEKQISAIKLAKERVERFERKILAQIGFKYEDELGVKIHWEHRPIRSVGCYIPGGEASYPSTVIMTVVPAKVAGVPRIVACSPPKRSGEIDSLTLVAADLCGVDEFYRVGGAQAIAALAYGTETINPVDKIVGPGNRYVLAAKSIVSSDVPIDHPAGPSEIVILADEEACPTYVAWDMIAQAEHSADSIAILVTTSMRIARLVLEKIMQLLNTVPNRDRVRAALERKGLILVANSVKEAVEFVNEFAPEHLEVIAEKAHEIAEQINSASLILVGNCTPVSLSDYSLGTNHVLPTGGFGRVYSPLSVLNFIKYVSIVEASKKALRELWEGIRVLAESEGLPNHALAIGERLKN